MCVSVCLSPHSSHHPLSPTSGPFSLLILYPLSQYVVLTRAKWDTCKECGSYKVQTDVEQDEATLAQLKGEWDLHLCKAECAHHQLKEDTGLSKSDPKVTSVTFDLQQSLPPPPF